MLREQQVTHPDCGPTVYTPAAGAQTDFRPQDFGKWADWLTRLRPKGTSPERYARAALRAIAIAWVRPTTLTPPSRCMIAPSVGRRAGSKAACLRARGFVPNAAGRGRITSIRRDEQLIKRMQRESGHSELLPNCASVSPR